MKFRKYSDQIHQISTRNVMVNVTKCYLINKYFIG